MKFLDRSEGAASLCKILVAFARNPHLAALVGCGEDATSAAIEATAASQLRQCCQRLAVLCCWTMEGLNDGSCFAADEEAGERESWTPWFATLSLLLCGRVLKDASAVEDMRSALLRVGHRCTAWVQVLR